jgi:hypothetical protein
VKVLTLKESLTELVKHDQGLVSRGAFAINVVSQVRRRGQPRSRETAVKIVNLYQRQRLKFLSAVAYSAKFVYKGSYIYAFFAFHGPELLLDVSTLSYY